ncbi:peroxiredoxin [Micromonospora aurantiaca]|uniref:peroxiredoxin n=1 Tax=Micromonospora aurantiaca (nom. illeg.) TaxID=47850 RepID=UPI003451AF74
MVVPKDDGAAGHLVGMRMPAMSLPATTDGVMRVDGVPPGANWLVLFGYPRTGRPAEVPIPGWDQIPGALGCTAEACSFRDLATDLGEAGAAVAGLSTQDSGYQREVADRLSLPFPLLSDEKRELTSALGLPTFAAAGHTLIKRITLVIANGLIEHVFYPVFPPDRHPAQVLGWLRHRPDPTVNR